MWGWLARTIDVAFARVIGRLGRHYFRDSTEADLRRPLSERLTAVPERRVHFVRERRTARGAVHCLLRVDRPDASIQTVCDFYRTGPARRLLVAYHHGLGEFPYDWSFRWIFLKSRAPAIPADYVCVCATSSGSRRELTNVPMAGIGAYMEMLCDSVAITAAVADRYRADYEHVVLAGTSLGGIVALLEAATTGRFDLNVSFLGGLDLLDVILHTSFSSLISRRFVNLCRRIPQRDHEHIARSLRQVQHRVAMINGTYDDYFRIERIQPLWAMCPHMWTRQIPYGHISGSLAGGVLRREFAAVLEAKGLLGSAPHRPEPAGTNPPQR